MNTKTSIIIKLQVEGLHNFALAKKMFPQVGFLQYPHRHIFHIKAAKEVFHDDRDEEFLMFKRTIFEWLYSQYYDDELNLLDFGGMSCEMIARNILEYFHCEWVEVWEDDENGARVECI
jgi:hypothetical protein